MREVKIGDQVYREKQITDEVQIPGGPLLRISGVTVLINDETGEELMDALSGRKRDQKIIQYLLERYGNQKVPGKVADFWRKLISLKLSEWAELSDVDASALSHAATRNSLVDRFACYVLRQLSIDFLTGSNQGRKTVEEAKKAPKIDLGEPHGVKEVA